MFNHKLCRFLLITILSSFLVSTPFALTHGQEWVSNGPYGGEIKAIAVHPEDENFVLAGTDYGLFQSKNGGASWKETKINDWIGDILFDPSDPQVIYVGAGNGFHKSFDGGKKWFTSGVQGVNDIVIDPSNPKIIYAATEDGLYQSPDGGGFWGKLGFERTGSVAVHPTNSDIIYVGTRPTGEWNDETGHETDGAVYKSTDGGEDWKLVLDPSKEYKDNQVDSMVIDPKNPDIIYVGIRYAKARGVFKSTDGGESWEKVGGLDDDIHFIMFEQRDTEKIYVGVGDGRNKLYQSIDGGSTWSPFGGISMRVNDIVISPSNSNVIYLATSGGIQKSTDRGATWTMMNQGITALNVRYVAVKPEATGVLYAAASHGIYKSTDGGSTWRLSSLEGGDVRQILTDPANKDVLYAACVGGNIGGTVYKSFDGGDSWWRPDMDFCGAACIAIALSDHRIIYGGSKHGGDACVYRSADRGASWDEIRVTDEAGREYRHVHSLAVDAADPNTVYAYIQSEGENWGIYKSTNGGRSWKVLIMNLCGGWEQPQQIATHPTAPTLCILLDVVLVG